jgi:diphthamide synthase (EF-2-diphthine--ammonia ligase)
MKSDAESHVNKANLSELMRFKDGDQTVKFYVKEGKDENHVKELFMLISGLKELTKDSKIEINGEKREFETVVVSITGDIDLREISKITSTMNVPGGKNLEKVGKKN